MHQPPTAHRIDPATGAMSHATGRYEKRLRDLAGRLFTESAPTVSAIGPVAQLMDIESIRAGLLSGEPEPRGNVRFAVG